jgi:hypothetical protein
VQGIGNFDLARGPKEAATKRIFFSLRFANRRTPKVPTYPIPGIVYSPQKIYVRNHSRLRRLACVWKGSHGVQRVIRLGRVPPMQPLALRILQDSAPGAAPAGLEPNQEASYPACLANSVVPVGVQAVSTIQNPTGDTTRDLKLAPAGCHPTPTFQSRYVFCARSIFLPW